MTGAQRTFTRNPYYMRYMEQLRDLHSLIAAGKGNSEEADALREEMDVPGSELSRAEVARLNLLSADLYALHGRELYAQGEGADLSPAQRRHWVEEAWRGRSWEEVLARLRTGPVGLRPDEVAFVRARAHEELGHLEAAIQFLLQAVQINPQDDTYPVLQLEWLLRAGRFAEAAEVAERYYADEDAPVAVRIQAAGVLYGATRHLTEREARPVYERLAGDLAAFPGLSGFADAPDTVQGLAYTIYGLSSAALDQPEAARQALDAALAVDPDNHAALVARALVVVRTDPDAASSDFRRAVEKGTPLVIPYLFLAQKAFLSGDFEDVTRLCERALHLGPGPEEEAELRHLHALGRLSLQQPAEAVRSELVTSLRLDPLNESIRRNVEYFEGLRQKAPPMEWQRAQWPSPEVLDTRRASAALRDITLPPS